MADITLTGSDGKERPCASGDVWLPYRGNWTSHLTLVDQDPPPAGKVTLRFHDLTLKGYVLRAGQAEALSTVLLAGGAGGLDQPIPPKYYDHQVSVRLPLQEILSAAGEVLSGTSSPEVLARTLRSWPRAGDEPGALLDELAEEVGAVWRVLPDGSVFFGEDAWTQVPGYLDRTGYQLLHTDPEWNYQKLAPITVQVLPGRSFLLGRVGRVVLEDDGTAFLQHLYYQDEQAEDDPLSAGIRGLVQQELRGQRWLSPQSGAVVQQRPDGSLDVVLDDRRLPPPTSVPVLVLVPGAKLRVQPGARVQIVFAGGDPTRPLAQLYESGAATRGASRLGDSVDAKAAMGTWMQQVAQAINAQWPGSVTPEVPLAFGVISTASEDLLLP